MADGISIAEIIGKMLPEQQVEINSSGGSTNINVIDKSEMDLSELNANDKAIINVLQDIYRVLMEQLQFDRLSQESKELQQITIPKDYEIIKEQPSGETAQQQVAKELTDTGSSFVAIIPGLSNLKAIFESLVIWGPKLAITSGIIGTILYSLEKLGNIIREKFNLPDISHDTFNMNDSIGALGRGIENTNRPMTQEEFEQKRIPMTEGGEASRINFSRSLSDNEFEQKRIPMTEGGESIRFEKGTKSSKSFETNSPVLMQNLMKDFGLTKEQAAGIVGNLAHESGGLVPGIQEKGGGGIGWAQWTGSRRKDFENYLKETGQSASDPNANYGFLKKELQENPQYKKTIQKIKSAENYEESTWIFHQGYEKSADVKDGKIVKPGLYENRLRYAKKAAGLDIENDNISDGPSQIAKEQTLIEPKESASLNKNESILNKDIVKVPNNKEGILLSTAYKNELFDKNESVNKEGILLSTVHKKELFDDNAANLNTIIPNNKPQSILGDNPFYSIQNEVNKIGSAVSIGQGMKQTIGQRGLYGVQGTIGSVQSVLGIGGINSPELRGIQTVLGDVGNIIGSVQSVKGMSKGTGILGGINNVSGVLGSLGNIFNSGNRIGKTVESSVPKVSAIDRVPITDNKLLESTETIPSIMDNVSNIASEDVDNIYSESSKLGENLVGMQNENIDRKIEGLGVSDLGSAINQSNIGQSVSGASVASKTTGFGAGNGGGFKSGDARAGTSSGAMGIQLGVRNEESVLQKAQYAAVRVV